MVRLFKHHVPQTLLLPVLITFLLHCERNMAKAAP
jgi:hypothetical protein